MILAGEATFTDADGAETVVGPHDGMLIPRGTEYRFESSGKENLVTPRVGAGDTKGESVNVPYPEVMVTRNGRPTSQRRKQDRIGTRLPAPRADLRVGKPMTGRSLPPALPAAPWGSAPGGPQRLTLPTPGPALGGEGPLIHCCQWHDDHAESNVDGRVRGVSSCPTP